MHIVCLCVYIQALAVLQRELLWLYPQQFLVFSLCIRNFFSFLYPLPVSYPLDAFGIR